MAKDPAEQTQDRGPQPRLTPELMARLRRMAMAHGVTVEQELEAIVTRSWIAHGTGTRKW